jgi:transcriptional regulator with GAF, ATPase, and Fis domain
MRTLIGRSDRLSCREATTLSLQASQVPDCACQFRQKSESECSAEVYVCQLDSNGVHTWISGGSRGPHQSARAGRKWTSINRFRLASELRIARLRTRDATMEAALIGVSRALCGIAQEVDDVARFEAKVLITGESGVGKDIVARLIHQRSRRQGPFVTINCAGVPDSLLESELFGHVRGSFTGAYRDKRGWLDRAEGGTIFLDEVGEMTLRMQALFLRFVENGEIQPVGSEHVQTVGNVRIVAATNRNLVERVGQRQFREDLYYRLNVVHIVVPPLRERLDDIRPLAEHFLDVFSAAYHLPRPTLGDEALAQLTAYRWPGNVRELSNVLERIVVRNRATVISEADVFSAGLAYSIVRSTSPQRETPDVLYERMVKAGDSFWSVVHSPFTSHDLTRADLRALVGRGLEQTRGNYRNLLTLFNVPQQDYKRFLNFLAKHGCHRRFHEFRSVPVAPAFRNGTAPSATPKGQ